MRATNSEVFYSPIQVRLSYPNSKPLWHWQRWLPGRFRHCEFSPHELRPSAHSSTSESKREQDNVMFFFTSKPGMRRLKSTWGAIRMETKAVIRLTIVSIACTRTTPGLLVVKGVVQSVGNTTVLLWEPRLRRGPSQFCQQGETDQLLAH